MLNKVVYYSLHSRLVILVCILLLVIWGTHTTFNTNVDVFPDLDAPMIVIMTEASGMAPGEVEHLVTFLVEITVNGTMDVQCVRSPSTIGFSVVRTEFNWGTDIYRARQIVSEKLAVLGESPPESIGKPALGSQSSILGEMMALGLTTDSTSLLGLRTIADWTIRSRLLSTGGVTRVAVIGSDIKEYQILLDLARMKYYGVGSNKVLDVYRDMNRNASDGVLYEFSSECIIRGILSTSKVEEIVQGVAETVNEYPTTLGNIATVKIGGKSPKLGTASGRIEPVVLAIVTKQPDTSTERLTEKLGGIVVDLRKSLPADVHVSTNIFRQNHFIGNSINNVKRNSSEGSLFAAIILFLFSMSIRITAISLVALPLFLLASVVVLHYVGLTINMMSLGGMTIAIDSLVDDAIADMENVYRRIRENRLLPSNQQHSTLEVVYGASREVRMPILSSALTIAVNFVSLFFLSGMEGRVLVPLGIAFIVALFVPTVVALILTPVLCGYLLDCKATGIKELREVWIARKLKVVYKRTLELVLAYQGQVFGTTIALFVVVLVIFSHLGRSFLLPFNKGSFTTNVNSLPGISLDESDQIGRRAEALLLQVPEIRTVARKTGRAELDEHALGVNISEIEAPFKLQDRSRDKVMNDVHKELSTISGANIEIGQPIPHRIDAMFFGTEVNITIRLFGTGSNLVFTVGDRIKATIQAIPDLVDLRTKQQVECPQSIITPRRGLLAKYGISLPEFEEYINVVLGGEAISQVYDDSKSFDLAVKTLDASRATIDDTGNLMIDTAGQKVPLGYVAGVRLVTGPNMVNHEDV